MKMMSRLYFSTFLCFMFLSLSRAGADIVERSAGSDEDPEDAVGRVEKRSMSYWNMWSSDFYGWMEELRAQAAYDTLLELANTYWSHFPLAAYLGYDSVPDQEETETD